MTMLVTTCTVHGYHTYSTWLPHIQCMVTTRTVHGYHTYSAWLPHVQCMVTTRTTVHGYHTYNRAWLPHVVTTHTWNVNGVRPSSPSIGRALRGGGQQPNTVQFKLRQLHLHLVTRVEDNLPPFVLLKVLRGQSLHEPYLHRHALQEVVLPAPPILRLLPLQDEFFGLLQVSQLLLREVVPLAVVM